MNKKGLFIIILCLTLFFISGCDQEQTGTDEGTDKIYQILTENSLIQGLFGADKNLAEDIVIMRMLFAILIFAIIYGTSEIALKGIARNARIAIGIIIAIISVIAVPEKLFLGVAQAYGGFIMFIMMGIPVFIGLFLIFKVFKEPTRFNYTAKFAIAALLFYISGRFAKDSLIGVTEAFDTVGGVWGGISSITAFASSMFLLMAIYFFIRIFSSGGSAISEKAGELPEHTKEAAKNVQKWWRRRGGPEFNQITGLISNLQAAVSAKDKDKLAKVVKGISTVENRTKSLETWSYDAVKKFEDTSARDDALDNIKEAVAAHRGMAEKLREIEKKIPGKKETISDKDWAQIKTVADKIDEFSRTARAKELEFLDKLK